MFPSVDPVSQPAPMTPSGGEQVDADVHITAISSLSLEDPFERESLLDLTGTEDFCRANLLDASENEVEELS